MGEYPTAGVPHVFIHVMGDVYFRPTDANGREIFMDMVKSYQRNLNLQEHMTPDQYTALFFGLSHGAS